MLEECWVLSVGGAEEGRRRRVLALPYKLQVGSSLVNVVNEDASQLWQQKSWRIYPFNSFKVYWKNKKFSCIICKCSFFIYEYYFHCLSNWAWNIFSGLRCNIKALDQECSKIQIGWYLLISPWLNVTSFKMLFLLFREF